MTLPDYGVIHPAHYEAALALWDRVFGAGDGYFRRYFEIDPWYRPGDCFGAWVEGRLVSAVHVCRRPVLQGDRTLWCGAIANVATEPDHRRQGLSRELLRCAIALMEAERIDFSMLFTGSFGHYAALGWEEVLTPGAAVTVSTALAEGGANCEVTERVRFDPMELQTLWSAASRPLALQRPEVYWRGWSGWEWRHDGGRVFVLPERGYVVLSLPKDNAEALDVVEAVAVDAASERSLLCHAGAVVLAVGRTRLRLPNLPQAGAMVLEDAGAVDVSRRRGMMLRNLCLPAAQFEAVKEAYVTGAAAWRPADGF